MEVKKKKLFFNLINFRPMFFMGISIAVGIGLGYLYFFNKITIFILLLSVYLISILSFLIFSNRDNRKIHLIFYLVFLMCVVFGYVSINTTFSNYKEANLDNYQLKVSGKVVETNYSQESQKIILDDVLVSGAVKKSLDYKVNVYVTDGNFVVGDFIYYTSCLYDYDFTYSGEFTSGFISENIKYYSIVDKEDITVFENNKNIFELTKQFISESLSNGMSGEEYQVACSLLLGGSDVIDEDVISSFRNTGVAHIFAVSGLHIGFLAMVLSFIFSKIKINKLLKAIFTIIILFFYSGVCGFSASSIRAVIMASILLLSNNSGKKYDMLSSLSLAFFIILLFKPIQLFCVGFQLSFSAVGGILLFSKKINKLFSFLPEKVSTTLSTSISAQIMTLPFLLNYFSKVSFISVFVNVLFIPLVSTLFIGLFSLAIIGGIFSISNITLFVPKYCIRAFIYAIKFFDSQIFLLSIIVTSISIIIYFVCVLYASDLLNIRKIVKYIVCSVCIVAVITYSVIYQVNFTKKIKVIVSANTTLYCTNIDCDDEKTLIVSKFSNKNSLTRLMRDVEKNETIENLIILDSSESDSALYSTIYLFYENFALSKIYLPLSENEIANYQKVFKSIKIIALESISYVKSNELTIEIEKDNNFALVSGKDRSIVIMGNSDDNNFYNNKYSIKFCDLLVAMNREEVLENYFNSANTVSYSTSTKYYSVKNNGNYCINL